MDHHRRRMLQGLSASVLGYGLGDLLAIETAIAESSQPKRQARNVLVIYEEGGGRSFCYCHGDSAIGSRRTPQQWRTQRGVLELGPSRKDLPEWSLWRSAGDE